MTDYPARISHYRLTARLGRGAMGEVYRAVDERLGREVAIKLLPESVAASADRQARFLREAQAAGALNHPSIVTVHDIGDWQGRMFLVMELVDGQRLSELARKPSARAPVREALRLCADAADALAIAHARGILHRDVKADNLMRTRDGRLKVLDFGLAKLRAGVDGPLASISSAGASRGSSAGSGAGTSGGARTAATRATPEQASAGSGSRPGPSAPPALWGLGPRPEEVELLAAADTVTGSIEPLSAPAASLPASGPAASAPSSPSGGDLTVAGELVGTPAYMSPEQARRQPADAQSEVFSLGIVLYELLTGRRPFDRDTIHDTLEAVCTAEVVPPSRLAPDRGIPPSVDEVVMRALAREPVDRFPDMAAFSAAARAAMEGIGRKRDTRRVWLGAGVAAAVALAALVTARIAGGPDEVSPTASPSTAAAAPLTAFTSATAAPATMAAIRSNRRITFDPGCEEVPDFLADGRTVLFDTLVDGDYELASLDVESGARRRLTHEKGWDYCATVSPDGTRIAYLHLADGGDELRLLPIGGDEAGRPVSLGLIVSCPAWTADGALIGGSEAGEIFRWDLATAVPSRSVVTKIGAGLVPGYLAGLAGGTIAVAWEHASKPYEFVLAAIAPDGSAQVLEEKVTNIDGNLEPDRTREGLYYVRRAATGPELVWRRLGSAAAEPVAPGIVPTSGFSVSSDGRRLVYSTCDSHKFLARLRAGSAPVELSPRGAWRDRVPARLDDGRLLYVSDRSGADQLLILDLATGASRVLSEAASTAASVSPDGTLVAYADTARKGIHFIPLAGGEPRRLTADPTDADPQFTHDGAHVVFQRTIPGGGTQAFAVPIGGGAPRPVTPPGGRSPAVSPVTDFVVYLEARGTDTALMTTSLAAGGAPGVLLASPLPRGLYESPRFSRDGKRLLVVRKRTEVLEIVLGRAAPPAVRWKATTEGIGSVDYAPDGDGLIAAVETWEGDLWLAEGAFR